MSKNCNSKIEFQKKTPNLFLPDEIVSKEVEVNGSSSSDGIPPLGTREAVLAASRSAISTSAALVVSNSDIMEDAGLEGVQERVEESNGGLS